MASSSSSGSGSSELMSLEELPMGVVLRFQPTDAQLVDLVLYLYNQIIKGRAGNGKQAFPEFDIYGKNGLVPWAIWDSYQETKFPNQEFLYFFTKVKKMGNKGSRKRFNRTVGCGGIWSETEAAKPVHVDGIQGRLRKFRYENKNKSFEHHTAWMMEEFSIEQDDSDLVLCRMKRSDRKNKGKKRKAVEDEEENVRRTKQSKPEEQLPSHSHSHEQHSSADDDLTVIEKELTRLQLEGSTDQNSPATYISEENISSSPLTSQQHQLSSEDQSAESSNFHCQFD